MPRRCGGDRAEHGDRLAGGAGVEPGAAGDAGVEHGQQVQAGGPHLQAAAVGRRDQRAAVDLLVLHQAGVRQQLDVVQERDPRRAPRRAASPVLPVRLCPASTVSRFVPSRSISASSPACEEEDSPRTATIAAVPIAIPSADSAARSGRARSPTLATRSPSAATAARRGAHARLDVGDHLAVEHPDLARQLVGEAARRG